MGMIETMVETLSGGHGTTSPLLANAMRGLVGDSKERGPGVPWLLERLHAAGYGPTMKTWLGGGANMPISTKQLHVAIGDEMLAKMAARAGMSPDEFIAVMSEHLPGVIDRLSPDGELIIDPEPAAAHP